MALSIYAVHCKANHFIERKDGVGSEGNKWIPQRRTCKLVSL